MGPDAASPVLPSPNNGFFSRSLSKVSRSLEESPL